MGIYKLSDYSIAVKMINSLSWDKHVHEFEKYWSSTNQKWTQKYRMKGKNELHVFCEICLLLIGCFSVYFYVVLSYLLIVYLNTVSFFLHIGLSFDSFSHLTIYSINAFITVFIKQQNLHTHTHTHTHTISTDTFSRLSIILVCYQNIMK